MLVEKAMDYEKTSYRGLFNFCLLYTSSGWAQDRKNIFMVGDVKLNLLFPAVFCGIGLILFHKKFRSCQSETINTLLHLSLIHIL